MDAQLRELIPFLRDRNPQVRQIALSNLLSQTPKGSPHRNIFFAGLQAGGLQKPKETDVIRDLKLLCRDQLNVAHDAFRALVNLSDSPLLVPHLSDPSFLNFLVSYIINPQSILADLASMLLSNLTASSVACNHLLSMKVSAIPDERQANGLYTTESRSGSCTVPVPYPSGEAQELLALPLLIDAFVKGAQLDEDLSKRTRKGELHFLASVFANITISPAGRNYFLSPQPIEPLKPTGPLEYPLAKIVAFTEHKDTIRRGGVASTMKNCAFQAAGHKAFLSPDTDMVAVPPSTTEAPGIDALPYLLLPLAGPEEFDLEDQEKLLEPLQFLPPTKKREQDSAIRLTFVEILLLLCHTRFGREYMREHGVYEIVRAAHEAEPVDKISEHIERLVQLLKGDEPKIVNADEEEVVEVDLTNKPAVLPTVPVDDIFPKHDDEDDEDNKIEEV
ncbi:hypothetical protein BDQ12DRAFT_698154 [Crucibulum laeve]|uniref:Protein HGH1 homolog n=1 Tax=Crucibulum laeve TaxID=68775 RepID=A0A5C3M2K9_9AGAR|nr:hypothetical protein BDQ12DRAFT_698154 [Crucibulum laeve]